jgi:hypothetical protein
VSSRRPALVLLLFAAARLPLLVLRAPFFDELFTRWIAGKSFAGIVTALRQDSGPPFYYFVVHLLGDPSTMATRVLSLLFATVAIILTLQKKSVSEGASPLFFATLLLAVFPPAILFATDARAYAMCAMFITIAVLAIDDDRPFVAAFALVAAGYSHYYGVLFFPLLLISPARRRQTYWSAFAVALVLFIPGFWLALHQPAEAREWMTTAWPDALFVRPPVTLAIIGAVVVLLSLRVNRYMVMVLVPLLLAMALRVYVPMRFEAVIATPLVLWIATSLQTNRFRLPLMTAMICIAAIWTTLGIIDHAGRPPDSYRQAARWIAGNVPANETVVASGYCYLETLMNGGRHAVTAFPPEQAEHPGWRALPRPGVAAPAGAFYWIGERRAPELLILARQHRIIEPLFVNDRAMVALVR